MVIKDEIRSRELADNTWLLEYSDGGATSYILRGEQTALMIDPGYGLLNGRSFGENLIGQEIPWAANTHGHFDHAGGNGQFELVYMSRGAEREAKTVYPSLRDREFNLNYPIQFVEDGSLIELGGRQIEVFLIPGHSPGDAAFLDKKERILFVGDCIGNFVPLTYMMEDPQPCMEDYRDNLKKLLARRNEFDFICTGHGEALLPGELVERCLANAEHILSGVPGELTMPSKGPRPQPEGDWKWHGPRPGDFQVFLPEYKRLSHFSGTTIEYDLRYIYRHKNRWSAEENLAHFEKIADFAAYLRTTNNGNMDVDAFCNSDYGQELARRIQIRSQIENNPMEAECYYSGLGVRKELFEADNYFTRWALFTPLKKAEKMPLIVWNHGGNNAIEAEECLHGFVDLAAEKGFCICMAQNTNPDNILRIISLIRDKESIDEKRIYIGGFSQGGTQAIGAMTHHSEVFAGCFTSGVDIYRPWDNFDVRYTPEELDALREKHIPMLQVTGDCEPFWYAPLNDWKPITWNLTAPKCRPGAQDSFVHPGRNNDLDPTRITDPAKGKTEPMLDTGKGQQWRMTSMYEPGLEDDPAEWMVDTVNRRMELLNCEPRNKEKMLSPQNEIQRVTGIYGDREWTEVHFGLKHWMVDIRDRESRPGYRFVVVENSTHWPQLMLANMVCDYFNL